MLAGAMELSNEQVEAYRTEGYTLVRNLYSADEIAPLRAYMEEMVEQGEHFDDWPEGSMFVASSEEARTPAGTRVVGSIQSPSSHNEMFSRFCHAEKMVSAMAALLGGPVERYTDQTIMKLKYNCGPADGGCSFYHQDAYYWRNIPAGAGCNCWVAMDHVGEDNIALAVMPGSHQDSVLYEHETYFDEIRFQGSGAPAGQDHPRFRIPANDVDFSREELVPMEPGDGLFFTNYTWHRSEPNRSGENRYAYAIAYQLADSCKD